MIVDAESVDTVNMIEGFLRGDLLTYQIRTTGRDLSTFVATSCQAVGLDYSTGQPRTKVNLKASHQIQRISRSTTDYTLPVGSLQYIVDGYSIQKPDIVTIASGCGQGYATLPQANVTVNNNTNDLAFDFAYEGFDPCPARPPAIRYTADTETPKRRIVRVLTDRAIDAVYSEVNSDNQIVHKFREHSFPNGRYVADASPVGEVFFATPDMSIVVHEPKGRNMPVLTRDLIPAGIVTLIGAIWM